MCNLTEVVCRPEDTRETLLKKIRLATMPGGSLQQMFHPSYL
jgi:hypothetical protein